MFLTQNLNCELFAISLTAFSILGVGGKGEYRNQKKPLTQIL